MRVKELIETLRECLPEAKVFIVEEDTELNCKVVDRGGEVLIINEEDD